jgi:short-subunit dehydrogenase
MEFRGKTILLTGASGGIGLALSRQLAREKVNLALLARREHILRQLAEELKDSGSVILPVKCDVANKDETARACREIQARFGHVDIAIFNSGLGNRAAVDDFRVDIAREVFDVNVFGLLNFAGELLPNFIKRKEGMIVGVSSLADCRGLPKNRFYSASKAALTSLLESLRVELKEHGVKVITVKPGFVKTPMTERARYPKPFLMSAEKAAAIIIKGMKKEKSVIQFPLPIVLAAKLVRAMPGFLYERIAARIKR